MQQKIIRNCFFLFSIFSCWINNTPAFLASFCTPLVLVIIFTLTILFAVLRVVGRQKQNTKADGANRRRRKILKAVVSLSFLMGATWVFGLVLLATDHEALQYIFAVFNSLQGFFIFFFFAVTTQGSSRGSFSDSSSRRSSVTRRRSSLSRVKSEPTTVVNHIVSMVRARFEGQNEQDCPSPIFSNATQGSNIVSRNGSMAGSRRASAIYEKTPSRAVSQRSLMSSQPMLAGSAPEHSVTFTSPWSDQRREASILHDSKESVQLLSVKRAEWGAGIRSQVANPDLPSKSSIEHSTTNIDTGLSGSEVGISIQVNPVIKAWYEEAEAEAENDEQELVEHQT